MSLIYNSNTANLVNYNALDLNSVFYNENSVFDKWIELHIGTKRDENDTQGFLIVGSNGLFEVPSTVKKDYELDKESNYGFSILLFNSAVGVGGNLWRMFDGSANTNNSYSTATTSSTSVGIHITFPFPFIFKEVTLCQAPSYGGTKRPTHLTIKKLGEDNYLLSKSSVNNTGNTETVFSIFTNNTTPHSGKIVYTFTCASTSAQLRIGELKMKILVKASDYNAWKQQYNLIGSTVIP